jgi:hypothetical protein
MDTPTEEVEQKIPLRLQLRMDANEARIIRDALLDYARAPERDMKDQAIAFLLLTTLSKKIIGR